MSEARNRTVFVSNIAPQISEDHLQKFFNFCGEIEIMRPVKYVFHCSDHNPNSTNSESLKYEIVFFDESSAQKAIKLNKTPMLGFNLNIVLADASSSTAQHQTVSHTGAAAEILMGASKESTLKVLNPFIQQIGDPSVDSNLVYSTGDIEKDKEIAKTVYVGNLNLRVTHKDLVDFFSSCGPIIYISLAGDDKHPCRFAFLEFMEIEGANKAILLSNHTFMDKEIKVNHSKRSITKPPPKLTIHEERKFADSLQYLHDKVKRHEEAAINVASSEKAPADSVPSSEAPTSGPSYDDRPSRDYYNDHHYRDRSDNYRDYNHSRSSYHYPSERSDRYRGSSYHHDHHRERRDDGGSYRGGRYSSPRSTNRRYSPYRESNQR